MQMEDDDNRTIFTSCFSSYCVFFCANQFQGNSDYQSTKAKMLTVYLHSRCAFAYLLLIETFVYLQHNLGLANIARQWVEKDQIVTSLTNVLLLARVLVLLDQQKHTNKYKINLQIQPPPE